MKTEIFVPFYSPALYKFFFYTKLKKKRPRKSEYKLIACPENRKHANPCWVSFTLKRRLNGEKMENTFFFVQKNLFNKIFTKETITMLYRPKIVHYIRKFNISTSLKEYRILRKNWSQLLTTINIRIRILLQRRIKLF